MYLDANVFIRASEQNSSACERLLTNVQDGRLVGVSSELTYAEVLARPLKYGQRDLLALYERVSSADWRLQLVPVSKGLLRRAAEVQATAGGRLPDAIHVPSALATDCRCLITSDARLKTVPAMPLLLIAHLPTES